ncbi:MAG: Asp-tRNA(Asn)/Glu-tRNA(Gln) amidotransferase subunit GatC [Patescibacteria group bacterium]
MSLQKSEVENLAKLARLQLTDQEISRLTNELADILNYVGKVNELASKVTSKLESTESALRADQIRTFTEEDKLLIVDKTDKNKLIKAPPVFGQN